MDNNNKDKQLHIRMSDKEKDKIKLLAKNNGYDNVSKYIMDTLLYETKEIVHEGNRIFTITLSPTLDYYIETNSNKNLSGVNKIDRTDITYDSGGRGINASKILQEFKKNNTSIYIAGGFSGEKLWKILDKQGSNQFRINNDIETRINVNIMSRGDMLALEGKTGPLSQSSKNQLTDFIKENIAKNDFVIFTGSFVDYDFSFVMKALGIIKNKTNNLFIDSSTSRIFDISREIKPKHILLDVNNNKEETIKSKKQIRTYCKKFIDLGVESVSFFSDVNITHFIDKDNVFMLETQHTDLTKTQVGSSDAFLGGLVATWDKPIEEKIKWASASQLAMSYDKESVYYKDILESFDKVKVTKD